MGWYTEFFWPTLRRAFFPMRSISIVIPAYNPGAYLDETLDCVQAQSFNDWECVVVDDGSTEDLSRVDTRDKRIKRIRQENRGLPIARNVGILNTTAPFIAFVDSDDLWAPSKLELQLERLQSYPDAGLCHTAMKIIDGEGRFVRPGWARNVTSYHELLARSSICVSSVMVRRSCLAVSGLFDPLLRSCEDYDMWLKISRFYRTEFLSEPLTLYRMHANNMSGNPSRMAQQSQFVLRRHLDLALHNADVTAANSARQSIRQGRLGWGTRAFDQARESLQHKNWSHLHVQLLDSFRLAPFFTLRQLFLFAIRKPKNRAKRNVSNNETT